MPLFTAQQLETRSAQSRSYNLSRGGIVKYASAKTMLAEHAEPKRLVYYDVFLSHRKVDADQFAGLVDILEDDFGLKVCVDWIEFPELDRSKVTPATANVLREAMRRSKCLFFATTKNYGASNWMPWELGYFDGFKQKVAIVPVVTSAAEAALEIYAGHEYLGLYPYVEQTTTTLYVHKGPLTYKNFLDWLASEDPFYRT